MSRTLRMGSRASTAPLPRSAGGTEPLPSSAPHEPRRCPTCKSLFSEGRQFCPFDGAVVVAEPSWDPSSDALIGKLIDGRYEVLGVLGEGGMGTVYEVRHTGLDRVFALKVLRRDIAFDEDAGERFLREARVAAGIEHENVVRVSDFGHLTSTTRPDLGALRLPFFVMERLRGHSLAARLKHAAKQVRQGGTRLDPEWVVDVVCQCAAGLAAAHKKGVVHRDLKPDNVFLSRVSSDAPEVVRLLDFGVARVAGASPLTQTGIVFGTPHYMSPEQANGDPIDFRADMYSLGVIMYECLSGDVPFRADNFLAVLTQHIFTEAEPLSKVIEDDERMVGLSPIVSKAMAKSPDDRFESMAALIDALTEVMPAGRTSAPPARLSDGPSGPASPRHAVASAPEAGSERAAELEFVLPTRGGRSAWLAMAAVVVLGGLLWLFFREPERPATGDTSQGVRSVEPETGSTAPRRQVAVQPGEAASSPAPVTREAEMKQSEAPASPVEPAAKPEVTASPVGDAPRKNAEVVDPWGE